MPNHCNNTLKIEGKRSQVFDFAREQYSVPEEWDCPSKTGRHASSRDKSLLDFSVAVPYPPMNERSTWADTKNLTHSGWYDYHVEKWGTKWGSYDVFPQTFPEVLANISEDWEQDHGQTEYTFDTAWSPPIPWVEAVSANYPKLTFTLCFEEPGCDYVGYHKVENGEVIAEDCRTCSEFAPEDTDWDDEEQAENAWDEQRVGISEYFGEIL